MNEETKKWKERMTQVLKDIVNSSEPFKIRDQIRDLITKLEEIK